MIKSSQYTLLAYRITKLTFDKMHYITISYLFALAVVGNANPPIASYIPISTIGHIANPNYGFNYAVNDPHTGDNKAQWEERNGDVVKGSYSLVEPDGTLRVVDYTADDATGFNAIVKRIGHSVHPGAIPVMPIRAPLVVPPIKPMAPIVTEPFFHPLPAPIPPYLSAGYPRPIAPFATSLTRPILKPISHWTKPIVVAEPIPIRSFDHLFVPLVAPMTSPSRSPPLTISGATYGKRGVASSWSSGPINLDGRSLIIRHKH